VDLASTLVQVLIALSCGLAANILLPRQIPGKMVGLFLVGLLGVALGQLGYALLKSQLTLNLPLLHWSLEGVPIIPSIIGSVLVLYAVTTMMRWGRYGN